jgi:CheY-like chemotaxis protein
MVAIHPTFRSPAHANRDQTVTAYIANSLLRILLHSGASLMTEPCSHMTETTKAASGCDLPAVLLVDDDPLVRESLADLLRELPLFVLEAESGEQAVAVLDCRPDIRLLVTDMMMPGMDGRRLAATARRMRPNLRVLFLSGLDRPNDGEAFLAKPVPACTLLSIVDRMISQVEPARRSYRAA